MLTVDLVFGGAVGTGLTAGDLDPGFPTYTWYRDTNGDGTFVATGDTGSNYTLELDDVDDAIRVVVNWEDTIGTIGPTTYLGSATYTAGFVDGAGTGTISISGTGNQNDTLSVDMSAFSDPNDVGGTVADGIQGITNYTWYANGVQVATGLGASTYTPGQGDVGKVITVDVTYADGRGNLSTVTSTATAAIVDVNDAGTGAVTFNTGTSVEGTVITIDSLAITDIDGGGSSGNDFVLGDMTSWTWMRDGVAITGLAANSLTYTLSAKDVGTTITVEFTYNDASFANTFDSSGFGVSALSSNRSGGATVVGDIIDVATTAFTDFNATSAGLTEEQDGGMVFVYSQTAADHWSNLQDSEVFIAFASKTGEKHSFDYYDENGILVGDDVTSVQVSANAAAQQVDGQVAVSGNGTILVTWAVPDASSFGDSSGWGIVGQLYTYDALTRSVYKQGTTFLVNTTTANAQTSQTSYTLSDGSIMVVWATAGVAEVSLQKFDVDGAKDGAQIDVTTVSGEGNLPSFCELDDGGFVVGYSSNNMGGVADAYAAVYDENGLHVTNITLSSGAATSQKVQVVALGDGGFAATWFQDGDVDGGGSAIVTQTFDADGVADGDAVVVNSYVPGNQEDFTVIALSGGGYYVVWAQENIEATPTAGYDYALYGQRYADDGSTVGAQTFLVETQNIDTDIPWDYGDTTARPHLSEMDNGGLILTYQSSTDGTNYDSHSYRIDISGTSRAGLADVSVAGRNGIDEEVTVGEDITYKYAFTGQYETNEDTIISVYFVPVPTVANPDLTTYAPDYDLIDLIDGVAAVTTIDVSGFTDFGWESGEIDITHDQLRAALEAQGYDFTDTATEMEAGLLFAVIDQGGDISERSEINNVTQHIRISLGDLDGDGTASEGVDADGGEKTLVSTGLVAGADAWPDIVLHQFQVEDSTPSEGEDFKVSASIYNQGLADADSIITNFYWSATEIFDFDSATNIGSVTHLDIDSREFDLDRKITLTYETIQALGDGYLFAVTNNDPTAEEMWNGYNVSAPVEIDFYAPGTMGSFSNITLSVRDGESTDLGIGDDLFLEFEVTNSGFWQTFSSTAYVYWSSTSSFNIATATEIGSCNLGGIGVGETGDGSCRIDYSDLADLGTGGYIFVVLNRDGELNIESSSTNVSSGMSFTVERDPEIYGDVNLFVDNLASDDVALSEDEDLFLTFDAGNDGERDSGQTVATTFYWTSGTTFNRDNPLGVTEGHGTLDPGETKNEDVRIQYDDLHTISGGADGRIWAVIDDPNEVDPETDDNDNTDFIDYTFDNTSGDVNLRVLDLTSDDTSLEDDQDLFLTLTVDNNGSDDAPDTTGTRIFWDADGDLSAGAVELDYEGHGTLDAGENKIEAIRIQYHELFAASGGADGNIYAWIDADEEITESSEADNTDVLAYTFVSASTQPDLTVTDLASGDTSLDEGEDLFVTMTANNIGDGDADSSDTVYYWSEDATWDLGDTAIGSEPHSSLDAGESDGESTRLRYEAMEAADDGDGLGFVIAYIDAAGEIAESNETNNFDSLAVTLTAPTPTQPDLVIENFASGDTVLSEDEHLDVTMTAKNQGAGDAGGSTTRYFWSTNGASYDVTDVEIGHEGHSSLDAGETDAESTRLRWDDIFAASGGTAGHVIAVIDHDGEVAESNEGNNEASLAVTFDLTPVTDPNLTISINGVSDTTLDDGEDVTVTVSVGNDGGTEGAGRTTFIWSDDTTLGDADDVVVDSDGHGTLDPGETKVEAEKIDYDDLAATGYSTGYIFAVIDYDGDVAESNEGDNSDMSAMITITDTSVGAADLDITGQSLSTGTLAEDDDFFVFLDVANIGGTDADSTRSTIYVNTSASTVGGVALEEDHHGELKAGETEFGEKTRIRWEEVEAYSGQTVYIYAVIDAANAIAESDEGNNVSSFMALDIA